MQPVTFVYNDYVFTTDKAQMQPEAIHRWLSEESYWAKHVPYEVVKTSFDNSFCMGILKDNRQVGYARLITDYATFAYLADVYVEEEHRAKGLGKKMVETLMELPWMKGLRKILLATLNAHELYSRYGFVQPAIPERYMEINRPVIYGDLQNACN